MSVDGNGKMREYPGKQKVEYLVTPRGGLQLSIDNFRFARDRVLQNVVTYRCVHYKPLGCMARVKTYEAEKKLQILQNKHNHPAYMDRRRNGALRSLLNARKHFSKASSNGMANIIYWRCTEYRKQKCRSTLKTMGKQLYIIDAKHNHVPKKYGRIMSATLPIFNCLPDDDLALEVDVSNELTRKLPDVTLFKTNRAKAEKKKADSSVPASSLLLQQQQQSPASIALSDSSGKKSKKIGSTVQVVTPNVDTVKMINNVRPNPDHIVKQLSNGHTLMKLVKTRVPKRQRQLQLTVGIKSAQNRTNIRKPTNLPQGATTTTKPKESITPTKTPSISDLGYEIVPVPGFKFPLQQRSDVENLENAIQNNKDIRKKYIAFLAQPLNAYNLHGSNTSGRAKIPMKTYSVFYDCFIELTVEVERLKKRLVELRGYGRKHSQNHSNVEMLTIQEKLRSIDEHFYKDHSIDPRKPLTISGFPMPLQCEEDVDRLELMVNRNPKIRAQYIRFLASKKLPNETIGACFKRFFTHWSLYNFSMQKPVGPDRKKQSMREFKLFTECMLDSNKATPPSKMKIFTIQPESGTAGMMSRTLSFPLATSDDIECLEQYVKRSTEIKKQYESILLRHLLKASLKPAFALLRIFTEESLADYNYSGHCNYTRDKKKAMKNYTIFTNCIEYKEAPRLCQCCSRAV
uniref:FLYWCH-type domain-containing protein n=1 Tax=Anopheles merus TaxID=30066 RepID=A0A182VMS0_ANOME